MKKALNTGLVVGALLLAAGTVAACGQAPAQSGGQPQQVGVRGPEVNAATMDAGGHAWTRSGANAVEVTANSGQTWQPVALPAPAATGHSVVVRGNLIAAVTVSGTGLTVQRSTDNGRTWQASALNGPAPTGAADLAVSDDGQHVAVLAQLPGGEASDGTGDLFVGGPQGALTPRSAPGGGDVTWVGDSLLLTGGPLHAQLFRSTDDGVSWAQQSVDGTKAPRFNVSPDVPSIGTPVPGGNGAELVPLTEHRGGAHVVVYTSADGAAFTAGPAVPLSGDVGPGVTAVVSPAGAGQYVVVDPASNALHVVRGGSQQVIHPTGLTGPVDSLTFTDAQHGIAEVAQSTGCAAKANCDTTEVSFRTADGGRTWQRATE
jgi:photosystem II stability/assembly factor-like uncharacterized protein